MRQDGTGQRRTGRQTRRGEMGWTDGTEEDRTGWGRYEMNGRDGNDGLRGRDGTDGRTGTGREQTGQDRKEGTEETGWTGRDCTGWDEIERDRTKWTTRTHGTGLDGTADGTDGTGWGKIT